MDYTLSLLKHQGDGLLGVIISTNSEEHYAAVVNHPTWKLIQTSKLAAELAYPPAICNVLLLSEETSDQLFRNIVDTWLGAINHDPLDDYAKYASQEEATALLDMSYLDQIEKGELQD